ncbi:MAG: sensor histidine kinase [Euzebyales bacterium]|nr:sensor histidine kinase [Euzebyales bacterium]
MIPGLENQRATRVVDVAVALVAVAAACIGSVAIERVTATPVRALDVGGYALLVAGGLALAVRRRQPAAVLAAAIATGIAYDLLGYPGAFFTVPILLALYFAAAASLRSLAVSGAVTTFVLMLVAGVGHQMDAAGMLWLAGWLGLALVLGEGARGRRAYLEQAEQRAEEAERTREEEALRRAGEERMRIARDLHDVLAHRIAQINVQAGVAVHLRDKEPAKAGEAMVVVKQASKQALRELRATLGVLRQVDEAEPLTPAPGLERLHDLVADTAAGDLQVDVSVIGTPRALPAGVDLAAYRIVQESLTNVVRHARPCRVTVRIAYEADGLLVQVADDGAAPVRDGVTGRNADGRGGGHGIQGMRERATAVGGRLDAGHLPEGGFRVQARLPLEPGA